MVSAAGVTVWSSQLSNSGGLCATRTNIGCHLAAVYSKSSNGGNRYNRPLGTSS